jgi:two-component system response regulator AtoC
MNLDQHRAMTASCTRKAHPPASIIFGCSSAMSGVRGVIEQISRVAIPIFISGETGTGKEVLANYIHQTSPWREGPFLKINCAAIPRNLLEAELFGFDAGAFTGARTAKPGLLEISRSGTLILDYISECDLSLQAKLLQFLQDGTFSRIGGLTEQHVSTRIICLANVSLEQEVEQGRFREDLYHRIAGVRLHMPLLRERLDDVPAIAEYLVSQFAVSFGVDPPCLSRELTRRLLRSAWPGHIRELENVLRRYVLLRTPDALLDGINLGSPALARMRPFQAGQDSSLKTRTRQLVKQAEAIAILQALEEHNWHRANSARSLNISLRGLLYKMRSAGISGRAPSRSAQPPFLLDKPDNLLSGS